MSINQHFNGEIGKLTAQKDGQRKWQFRRSCAAKWLTGNVQIPLGGPDQTLSETLFSDPGLRQSPFGPRGFPTSPWTLSGRIRPSPYPCSGIWHGPGQTLSLVGSDRVVSKFHCTNRTRPDPTKHVRACDQVSDKVWSVSNSTTRTHGLCLRPDPTRPDPRTKSVHIEICRTSLRPDKVRWLVGDPSGPWVVWSGPSSEI